MTNSKIYVKIPAQAIAGGVESLFQLSDAINNVGGQSIVVWDINNSNPIPSKYSHYNIQHSTQVEDSEKNWIIYPEVWTEKLNEYKNLKKGIWWLSVDNNHGKFNDFGNDSITHFYQSYYAQSFLVKKNTEKILPLFDYIPSNYIDTTFNIEDKKNIVCYNPVKGNDVTSEIKRLNPEIEFIPIVGMSESQIIDLLKISKVYIDFGHHPGRDRIPRESAILGNCVITNTKGSSGFYGDIPVNSIFKVTEITEVGNIIKNCFDKFELTLNHFSMYRNMIKNQKDQMYNLVKQYFI